MATDLRKTGIDVISQMPWGTHFCLFYETKEDLLEILVPYFKAGLEGNEFCVWVVADPLTEEDAWRSLSQAIPALERHRSNQSIEVLPARDWYLNDGQFELERVTSAWNRKLTQALARGYAGMRVSGDTHWLDKKSWQSFYEYENQLDESITDQLMTVLCTYPLTSSGAAEILDVARNHQFALARRNGAWVVVETDEALRRSESNFRTLADKSIQGIAIYQGSKIVYVNPAHCAIVGYTIEEFQSMSVEQVIALVHPLDRAVAEERSRKRSAGEELTPSVELRVVRKDGSTRWIQAFNNPIEYNGQPALLSTTIDITERKQAEEEIRRYATRMEVLAEISRTFAEVGLDFQDVLGTVARRTAELIGDSCVITLFSDNRQRLFPVAFHHSDPKALALMHDALMHTWQGGTDTQQRYSALLSGKSIYMPVVNPEELRALLEPELWLYVEAVGISSVLTVPLRLQGQVIGTLGLTRDQPGSPYTLADQVLLQDVALRAALAIENARLFEAVSEHRQQLRVLGARLAETQESERRQLALELHDEFGQSLTALKMDLAWLQDHLPPRSKGLREKVDSALDLTNETIQMTQRLASQLRPRMLDDLGLAAALEWHVDEWSKRTHVKTKITLPEEEWELDPSLNTGLYRVCQEALTNVVRHADASKAEVSLAREGDEVVLIVRDNGRGMDARKITAPESLGLLGMKERVEQIGGSFEVQSEAGKGTTVMACVPVSQSLSLQASYSSPKSSKERGHPRKMATKGRGSHGKKP